MRTQRTHLLALRAAAKVTSVSFTAAARGLRHFAVGAAASMVLTSAAAGCASDSEAGALPDATSQTDAVGSADGQNTSDTVAGLMDVILGDSFAPSQDAADPDVQSRTDVTADVQPSLDTAVTDTLLTDTGALDAGGEDAPLPEEDVQHPLDGGIADTGDVGLPESCLIPNGTLCDTAADCEVEGKWSILCVEGECHEQDMTPNEKAMACCEAHYQAGSFTPAGCNPWGPPAPPTDRGYRLEAIAGLVGADHAGLA